MATWEHLVFLVVFLTSLMFAVGGTTQPTPASADQLEAQLLRMMEEHQYSGARLGVIQEGKLVYLKGLGETNDGHTISPLQPFPIPSVSELLTAVVVMRLVEDNRLQLQDRVFGPDGILSFPATQDLQLYDRRILDITVMHLLQHTAGWESTKQSSEFHLVPSRHLSSHPNESRAKVDTGVMNDQLGQVVHSSSLDTSDPLPLTLDLTSDPSPLTLNLTSDPGTRFHLSDKDELLLRKVVETVSRQSYKDFVHTEVLEPLGMWTTELRLEKITTSQKKFLFEEGDINIDRHTPELTPTTENWYSTIPDILRLVRALKGVKPTRLLKEETVKKMFGKPWLPMPQHVEMWHGAGMQVNNNGTWWKGGSSGGVHAMVFCDGQNRLRGNQQTALYRQADVTAKQGVCWVICLHGNNPISPPIRRQLANMIHTFKEELPEKDLFILDYTDMVTELKSGKIVALKHGIPEFQMKAYLNGIQSLGYEVQWVSAYNVNNMRYFAVTLKKSKNETSQIVELYSSEKQLSNAVSELETKGYHVNFLTSYTSVLCHKICYIAAFVHKPGQDPQQTKARWGKTSDQCEDDKRDMITMGYVISMQSVVSVEDALYFSYILKKQSDVSKTVTYTSLTLSELEKAIQTNGLTEKTLAHLDAYITNDGIRFSAVFNTNRYGRWVFHGQLDEEMLAHEMGRSARLGYEPSVFVGYELEGVTYYAVMWILS